MTDREQGLIPSIDVGKVGFHSPEGLVPNVDGAGVAGHGINRSLLIDQIADVIARGRSQPLGIAGLMIADEHVAGRRTIQPGDTEPFVFDADDWVFPAVVSIDQDEVRIVAILGKNTGAGAFTTLIGNIRAAGYRPVVVEPVGHVMPAIMAKWGWRGRTVGRGIDRCSEWRPV